MPLNRQLQSGLSKAAGILSPTVYAKQQQSQMLQEQNDLAMRQTALKSVIESIKSGQLPGEQAVPAFQQLGLSPETSTLLAQNIRPTPVDNTDLLIKRRDQIAERVSLLPDNDPRKQVGLNRLGEIDSLIQQKTGFEGSSDPALFANVDKTTESGDLVNMQFPDGTVKSFMKNDVNSIRSALDAGAVKTTTGKGITVGVDENGNPVVQIGGQTGMAAKTRGTLEAEVLNAGNRIARLQEIESQIVNNPEMLQVQSKAKALGLDIFEKVGGDLSEDQKEFLSKQTDFVRTSIENINSYIKEITGAQMSEKEASRLRLAQPDPGEGVFGGQGPTKFISNTKSALKAARLSQARARFFLDNGIMHDFEAEEAKRKRGLSSKEPPVSLEAMDRIIQDAGIQEAERIKAENPNMSDEQVINMARENVQKQFGMIQ